MAILNTDGTQYAFSKIKNELNQLKSDLDNKANTSDVLTLEEIQASTDLSGKIAGASAIKSFKGEWITNVISAENPKIIEYYNDGLKLAIISVNTMVSTDFDNISLSRKPIETFNFSMRGSTSYCTITINGLIVGNDLANWSVGGFLYPIQ